MGKIAILSGRYELVHAGHIKTIEFQAKRFDTLYVFVVDNPDSAIPSIWSMEMIQIATKSLGNVVVVLHPCHFGYARKEDIENLPKHDVFLSGNQDVTSHLRSLGVNVEEIDQTPGYSSTEIKHALLRQAIDEWRKGTGK